MYFTIIVTLKKGNKVETIEATGSKPQYAEEEIKRMEKSYLADGYVIVSKKMEC